MNLWKFLLPLLLVSPAVAQEVAVKDLRKPGSKSTKAVVLCAREGVPGHAFVVLGKEDEKRMMSTIEAFGFYPEKKDLKPLFGTVPGSLANEFIRGKGTKNDHSLILKVDDEQFAAVEKLRADWAKRKPDYKLFERNCITFTGEAAKALGLTVPAGKDTDLPPTFLKNLIEKNK